MGTSAPLTYDAAVKFGERLHAIRQRAGLSLSQVSERSGLTRSSWHQYESGKRGNPTLAVMHAMAAALDVELSELLDGVTPDDT